MMSVLTRRALLYTGALFFILPAARGQAHDGQGGASDSAFDSGPLDESHSRLRAWIERFETDLRTLERSEGLDLSTRYRERMTDFREGWLERLRSLEFGTLERDEQVDHVLLRLQIESGLKDLARDGEQFSEMAELLPFVDAIATLAEQRRRTETIDAPAAANMLSELTKKLTDTQTRLDRGRRPARDRGDEGDDESDDALRPKATVALRAADALNRLRGAARGWYEFYNEYDPLFTWWVEQPYQGLDQAFDAYGRALRERGTGAPAGERRAPAPGQTEVAPRPGPAGGGRGALGGTFGGRGGGGGRGGFGGEAADPRGPIIGNPVGRDALVDALSAQLIPYTPEELIALGEKEMAWCEAEMKKAAGELGFGDDWKAALESVKQKHLKPGEQPDLVRKLAAEAIEFVESRELLTIPPLAKDSWRMSMMSPEAQLQNPFFLGGESIIVAFPTRGMSHEDKLMSMRGNNIHFARATVHHELIPGHNLQAFMNSRYRTYRRPFGTPFWTEGWALYWELRLWDLGFPKTPEDKIGMLFWRMHRGARIIFSLRFHMEEMKPQECVDYLVERVGHERANAEAEVRRSFAGAYEPLYQCAYLLGGYQFRALHKELVVGGKMSEREFHDRILRNGTMPVALVRASLSEVPLAADEQPNWRFADEKDAE